MTAAQTTAAQTTASHLTKQTALDILSRMSSIRFTGRALVLSALLAICGCSESVPERFAVDPALLGPAHSDSTLRIRFQPPSRFLPADAAFLADQRRTLLTVSKNEPYEVLPAMIFSIPERDARCLVFTLPNARGADFGSAPWREGYLEAARQKVGTNEFQAEVTARDGLDLLAVTIEGLVFVNRRFVFASPQGDVLQIDYILPDSMAAGLSPAIESSIGALTFF